MKLADLTTSGYFLDGVADVVEELAGKDSEIAGILAEDDGLRRRVLVATKLGVIDCFLDMEKPAVARSVGRPIEIRLTRWDEWPRLTIQGETYSAQRWSYDTTWQVEGWPDGIKIDHARQRGREIVEFVRACIEQQRRAGNG